MRTLNVYSSSIDLTLLSGERRFQPYHREVPTLMINPLSCVYLLVESRSLILSDLIVFRSTDLMQGFQWSTANRLTDSLERSSKLFPSWSVDWSNY